MGVREVIEIDEKLCDGCGDCVTACAEGAIAIIDGKARLISDVYCDGLGACLGHCPQGALKVIQREADSFDERAVEDHLSQLREKNATTAALPQLSVVSPQPMMGGGGCPGSRPFFQNKDVLLAADCVAFAVGDFHQRFLAGSSLAIACPKLDSNQEIYLQKLVAMIDEAKIRSLKVMVMEVPCCGGLVRLAEEALRRAERDLPVECLVVGTQGHILGEYQIAG